MGMSVEGGLCLQGVGLRHQSANAVFYILPVAVGHKKPNTTYIVADGLQDTGGTPVAIAVARHLMDRQVGKLFRQGASVIIVVSQVDHLVRLHCRHASAHKAQSRMGIRENQDFHTAPPVLSLHIINRKIYYITQRNRRQPPCRKNLRIFPRSKLRR